MKWNPVVAESRALRAVLSRIAAALLGGYAFCWGFVSLAILLLGAGGMGYDDAWMLVMILAFPLYLVLVLWAFVARSLSRVWMVLASGAAVMTVAAHLLMARLPAVT